MSNLIQRLRDAERNGENPLEILLSATAEEEEGEVEEGWDEQRRQSEPDLQERQERQEEQQDQEGGEGELDDNGSSSVTDAATDSSSEPEPVIEPVMEPVPRSAQVSVSSLHT